MVSTPCTVAVDTCLKFARSTTSSGSVVVIAAVSSVPDVVAAILYFEK